MRVLMLGWEFPPFITGGLGTACAGLTRALAKGGTDLTFVLPGPADPNAVEHMQLIAPGQVSTGSSQAGVRDHSQAEPSPASFSTTPPSGATVPPSSAPSPLPEQTSPQDIDPIATMGSYASAYAGATPSTAAQAVQWAAESDAQPSAGPDDLPSPRRNAAEPEHGMNEQPACEPLGDDSAEHSVVNDDSGGEGGGIIDAVRRYARFVETAVADLNFDVIHAHDWLTWPAALRVARRTGRPLIVHVHSTEFDRSGESVHPVIHDIERRGMLGAMRVITVSQLTRNIVVERYGVDPAKVTVVYNGIEMDPIDSGLSPIGRREKIVLYFGRITRQKGPEFFIRAAARVLELRQDVRFVVAGSGDLYQRCVELAAELGIGQHFLFTGFLRGEDIQKVFSMADLFVMPSVSEPFGIAPLEAMSHDVPVLISKSSGVSEVLTHALKVDFWDTEAMADKILAVLRYPPLGRTLRRAGPLDLRRLTWDDAARKCRQAYTEVVAAMGGVGV